MARILLVVTGADDHNRAVQWALGSAARQRPSTIVAVAICTPEPVLATPPAEPFFAWNPFAPGATELPAWTREHEQRHEAHRHTTHVALDATFHALQVPEGVKVVTQVLDRPHHRDQVTHLATHADLVVIDATGHRQESGCDPQQLAEHLLHRLRVPVVLVP